MENIFDQFQKTYSTYLPPILNDFLSPSDRESFLKARFSFLERRSDPVQISVQNPDETFYWLSYVTVIEILTPDFPFIVETVLEYLKSRGHRIHMIIHPVLKIQRDERGEALSIDYARDPGDFESSIYVEISRVPPGEQLRIEKGLRSNMAELRNIVDDFEGMKTRLREFCIRHPGRSEDVEWLADNFIFLGMALRSTGGELSRSSGLLRSRSFQKKLEEQRNTAPVQRAVRGRKPGDLVFVDSRLTGNVNPDRKMQIAFFIDDDHEILLCGYFARRAESSSRVTIPFIRDHLIETADRIHAHSTSYLRRELFSHSSVIPLEILFTRTPGMLLEWLLLMLNNVYNDEPVVRFFVDETYDTLWAIATMPSRDGAVIFQPLLDLLDENHIHLQYDIRRQRHKRSILILGMSSPEKDPSSILRLLEVRTQELFTSWKSRFRRVIENRCVGDQEIRNINYRYLERITPDHEIHMKPEEAFNDFEILDHMRPDDGRLVRIQSRDDETDVIKIHSLDAVVLSSLIPVIIHFGFTVLEEYTFPYHRPEGDTRYTTEFVVQKPKHTDLSYSRRVALCIQNVLNGQATDESINRLSVTASLTHRELEFCKALVGYTFQIDKSQGRLSLAQTLIRYPEFTRALVDFFRTEIGDPEITLSMATAREKLEETFGMLESVVEETICRNLSSVVSAIIRTNFLQPEIREIAFKVRSRDIPFMPRPVPLFEIYMYASDLEGIHLRSGKVARGGIRWSDRSDDFRTEILGLMKAQMVKNTLIVPAGSKGGFVIKNRTFDNRTARLEAGKSSYQRFIGNLLELTDNLDPEGNVTPPAGIARLDEDDPYLVVAADKGTATFSDLANEISESRNYWLGDAFASGGRNGYDHKKQGITARGAWESVRRLFLERGTDPDRDPISAVGIGDMSGDVFGNGMILSRSLRLLGAFNHMFIFLDPDPDPEKSFKERMRLFRSGGNWNDYNTTLISSGGGVFDRNSRKINLSREVKNALGVNRSSLSGEELIQAILKAPVDLLWNGGIGTYIKSSKETHFDAGDPSNDRVRINGNEVRARVIGEGGNLGLTQAGRIEAASAGVRLNTDAIDNSAGVDMSDHEVNLKILLERLIKKKKITGQEERNRIIRKLEKRMIESVLGHNISNNLALSLDEIRIRRQIPYLRSTIRTLVREGFLNRESDGMPLESELDLMEKEGKVPSRPVLASLMGFVKLRLSELLEEDYPFADSWYDRYLRFYFPGELSESFFPMIQNHPLKREIVLTTGLNEIVNHAGILFLETMRMKTGETYGKIADTYLRVSDFTGARELRRLLRNEKNRPALQVSYDFLIHLEERLTDIVLKILETEENPVFSDRDRRMFEEIHRDALQFAVYRPPRESRAWKTLQPGEKKEALEAFKKISILADAFELFLLRRKSGRGGETRAYFQMLDHYRIPELRKILQSIRPASPWEEPFLTRLHGILDRMTEELLDRDEESGNGKKGILDSIEEIFRLHETGTLTAAAMHELLQSVREGLNP